MATFIMFVTKHGNNRFKGVHFHITVLGYEINFLDRKEGSTVSSIICDQ